MFVRPGAGISILALWFSWLVSFHTGPRRPETIMDMENGLLGTYFLGKELAFYFHWSNYRAKSSPNETQETFEIKSPFNNTLELTIYTCFLLFCCLLHVLRAYGKKNKPL